MLKRISRLVPALAILLLAACAQNPVSAFSPAHSGFTVQMPGTANEQTTERGGHIYTTEVDGKAYIVSYSDLAPRVKVTRANVQQILDNARGGAVSDNKLLSEKKVTVEGHPGRDLGLQLKSGHYMRLRVMIADSTLYQVGVVAEMGQANAPEIAKFIDSFHFTPKQ